MSIIGTIRDAVTGLAASVEARKQTPTGNALNVQIGPGDTISNIPVIIDIGQHQIHEGESHGVEYYATSVSTISFGLTVPTFATTINAPHLIMHVDAYEGAGEIAMFEGATFTGGTLMTAYNRNRNSLVAPGMTVTSGVTVTGAGTRLPYTDFVAAGQKSSSIVRSNDEIVLKSNTIYAVVFTEISAITRLTIHFEWYEDLGV